MIDVSKLRSAKDLKGKIKEIFTDVQLEEMARNHCLPHYIIHHPVENKDYIYFVPTEVLEWVTQHCVKRNWVPIEQVLNFVDFDPKDCAISATDNVPGELCKIKNLYKLPSMILSSPPGVYFLCQGKDLVYIGQAKNVARRIADHLAAREKEFDQVYFIPCLVNQLNAIELALIRKYKPKYNIQNSGIARDRDMEIVDSFCTQNEVA